ncbi:hypothetical protein B296_00014441 [Ensete ventricosum]|uniref:Uncharacterized protein n=1 Tax=Ensete ventricosum TaxID=4639 RepID=A0A426Z5K0_ENSVE|nr:hypothetical protein B296_00014441 [Ensete ventricosum]
MKRTSLLQVGGVIPEMTPSTAGVHLFVDATIRYCFWLKPRMRERTGVGADTHKLFRNQRNVSSANIVNLHFSTVLADWVHDTGRVIGILSERNVTLRAEVLKLKSSVGLEVVTTAEKRATDLEAKVDQLKAALGSVEQEA